MKKTMPLYARVHEAAHAVVAEAVAPGSVQDVFCMPIISECWMVPLPPEERAVARFAGPVAQWRVTHRSRESTWVNGGLKDLLQAEELVDEDLDLLDKVKRDARMLVRVHWHAIRKVADALATPCHLSGDAVREIMHGG